MGMFALKGRANCEKLPLRSARRDRSLQKTRSEPAAILSADKMRWVLRAERLRTERSGNPFLLMLLDIETAAQCDQTGTLLRRMSSCLLASIRETDACGLYSEPTVLGIVFTEINAKASDSIEEVIRGRVVKALSSRLDDDELSQIVISTYVYPDKWSQLDTDDPPAARELYPDLADQFQEKKAARILKRVVDLFGSAMALLVLSPLMLLIAILTKLTSRGPVLFRQKRLGQHGRPFDVLKFRTMYCSSDQGVHKAYVSRFIAGCESEGEFQQGQAKVYKLANDHRVTPLGRLLRKASLDELPQFWNVLEGDMSLVGPRPPISYELEFYDLWHRRRLLDVKPGITGLWQVKGRSRIKFNEMVRLDLEYARTWSLWLDLKILFRTPRAVISGDGAY